MLDRTFHVGSFQASLEDALDSTVASVRRSEPLAPVYVLVPTHVLGLHLMRIIARRQGLCLNICFTTFPDLAEAVAIERIQALRQTRLPTMADFLVTRKAVNAKVGTGRYFVPIRDFPSTPRALLSSLTDLKKEGISAADMERSAGGLSQRNGSRNGQTEERSKLLELASIYAEVQRLQSEAGYFDDSDLLKIGTDAAATSPVLDGAAGIYLYGFSELNRLERQFYAACLGDRSAHAFVPEDVAGHAEPLVHWLGGLGFAADEIASALAGPKPESKDGRALNGTSIHLLAASLFSGKISDRPAHADVKLISAPGVAHEVQAIAQQILTPAATPGVPFSDIAVLLRNPGEYERTIRDVFDGAGIPHVFLDGTPALDTLAGRLLRLLMRIRLEDYPRPDTMEFLGLAPLKQRLLKESSEASPTDWDRYSREAGIVRGREHWRRIPDMRRRVEWRIERIQKETVGELDQATLAILRRDLGSLRVFERVVNLLLKRLSEIPEQGTVGDLMSRLLRSLLSLAALPEQDRAVVRALAQVARESVADEQVSFQTFGSLLDDLLADRLPPTNVYRSGRVVVSSLSGAQGLPFKVVFIPGLVERSFPPPARQDPIVLDSEREVLNGAFGAGLMTRERRPAEEQFAFRHALGAASEHVVLSYPRLDAATGQVRVPSHFLLRVAEALTGAPADFNTLEKLADRIPLGRFDAGATPATAGEWDLSLTVQALSARNPGKISGLPGFDAITRGTRAEARRWGTTGFTEYDGVLALPVTPPSTLAATQLETYGLCPFKFFGDRILGVREIDEPESVETLTPLDRGSIVHDILERLMSGLARDKMLPLAEARIDEYRDRLKRAAQDVFREFERSGAVGYPFMWRVEQERIVTDLEAFLALEVAESEGFVPTFFEARFGPTPWGTPPAESSPQPLEVDAKGHPLQLTGYIDRIDVHPSGTARVTDYKSGAIYGEKDNLFRGGQSLQLPIYILASDQMLKANGIRAKTSEAQYYYVTSKGRFRRIHFARQALTARGEEFATILHTMAKGISAGLFPQNPDGGKNCERCPFQRVCGHGRARLVERKITDMQISALRAMWEIE